MQVSNGYVQIGHSAMNAELFALIDEMFDQEVAFLQHLVRCKSANPFTPENARPDVPIEKEMSAIIAEQLLHLGYAPGLHGVTSERPNVVCSLPSAQSGHAKTLILTTHMDTVVPSTEYTRDSFGAHIEQGKLYGVGAADAKAQIAAFIFAAHAIHAARVPLAGNLMLAFVVDEESGACSPFGTKYLLEHGIIAGDAAIIGEPGDRKIATGHRGVYRFRIRTVGEGMHTGLKQWEMTLNKRNAALDMARLAVALSSCSLPFAPSPAFPGREPVLTFPTLIQGGSTINAVPDTCEAYGDLRLLPGMQEEEIKQALIFCLDSQPDIAYSLETISYIPAAEISQRAKIVQCLASAIKAVTGERVRREGAGPACDGWMFIAHGIPTVCGYGVACGGVHGADEWIDLASLRTVTKIYSETILQYLGTAVLVG